MIKRQEVCIIQPRLYVAMVFSWLLFSQLHWFKSMMELVETNDHYEQNNNNWCKTVCKAHIGLDPSLHISVPCEKMGTADAAKKTKCYCLFFDNRCIRRKREYGNTYGNGLLQRHTCTWRIITRSIN